MKNDSMISVVSPVYLAEEIVGRLVEENYNALSEITENFEIILVDDGSPDESWKVITACCKKDSRTIGVKLSKNFGQHYAITAGLKQARGEWIVVMDCDLQDQPSEIKKLLKETEKGFAIVTARRKERKDSFLKRMTSQLYYLIFQILTGIRQDPGISNFGIYHKKVIASILSMNDHIRYFPTMVNEVGFAKTSVDVNHAMRKSGKSSFTILKMLRMAFDNIINFSNQPILLVSFVGGIVSMCSILYGLICLIFSLIGTKSLLFDPVLFSIWFLSGLIILSLGICGIYISKIFAQTKNRPLYIIDEIVNERQA